MNNIRNSQTYQSDITLSTKSLCIAPLKNKSVLITGATGLICSAIVDILLWYNQYDNANITIYVAGRSLKRLWERFPDGKEFGLHPVEYDATKVPEFSFAVDYIIHGASNASPDKYLSEPVDTMMANIAGVHNLLSYARNCKLSKFVYISSSEVYGKGMLGRPMKEDDYGITDILSPRSSYPVGKQAAEALCIAYANQYDMDVSIVRPGHIYGPTAGSQDNRVSSAFAMQAACGKNLVMKSTGTQLRSYCYCLDCASAIITVLLYGKCREAYNISNKDSVLTIRKMAEILAEYAGVKLIMDIPTHSEKAAFNPMDNSSLDSEKLYKLGWNGQFDAVKGFTHTISILKEVSIP